MLLVMALAVMLPSDEEPATVLLVRELPLVTTSAGVFDILSTDLQKNS